MLKLQRGTRAILFITRPAKEQLDVVLCNFLRGVGSPLGFQSRFCLRSITSPIGAIERAALIWSVVWIAAGLVFNLFVWWLLGAAAAVEYLAVYAIEKALSLDNMFLFLIVFDSLGIVKAEQHKALFWGTRRGAIPREHDLPLALLALRSRSRACLRRVQLLTDPLVHIPPLISVAFTVIVIGGSVWLSLKKGLTGRK